MKALILVLVVGCIVAANAYGLDLETKNKTLHVYNLTTRLYNLISGLIDDLEEEEVEPGLAEKKIDEWEARYRKQTSSVPAEARTMCAAMNDMIEMTREIAREYRPHSQETKDMLDELDEIRTDLKNEMTELKYMIQ